MGTCDEAAVCGASYSHVLPVPLMRSDGSPSDVVGTVVPVHGPLPCSTSSLLHSNGSALSSMVRCMHGRMARGCYKGMPNGHAKEAVCGGNIRSCFKMIRPHIKHIYSNDVSLGYTTLGASQATDDV